MLRQYPPRLPSVAYVASLVCLSIGVLGRLLLMRIHIGHVALVDNTMSLTTRAIPPSGATLPSADLARSSHLTIDSGGSRISGLSAFPRPPSEQSADILASYFSQERDDDDMPELISAALQSPVSPTGESQGEWTHSP